jgi:hypothetical protein
LEDRARVKINLAEREIEIEGSEAFVGRWSERLEDMLALLGQTGAPPLPEPPESAADRPPAGEAELGPFGAFIQRLPNAATEVDKMLAAGFWSQGQSADQAFATSEASRLLAEHGVRIGNPSQCVRQSLMARRVFMVQKGRYRISQQGRGHLRQLMGASFVG